MNHIDFIGAVEKEFRGKKGGWGILSERHLPVVCDTDEALKVRAVETIPAGPGELMSPPNPARSDPLLPLIINNNPDYYTG